jgi:hypothetical protein
VEACRSRPHRRSPAVLFFFSRNPMIFGYMNYLMAFETLSATRPPAAHSPADFTIYAGDVLESLPKSYIVLALTGHAIPDVAPTDVLSFMLSSELVRELCAFAVSSPPSTRRAQEEARHAALERYRCFTSAPDSEAPARSQFFDDPAPKAPTTADPTGPLPPEGLAPQAEFFGIVPG